MSLMWLLFVLFLDLLHRNLENEKGEAFNHETGNGRLIILSISGKAARYTSIIERECEIDNGNFFITALITRRKSKSKCRLVKSITLFRRLGLKVVSVLYS